MSDSEMMDSKCPETFQGSVKWFNNKQGFGFINVTSKGEMEGNDVFVHHSAIQVSKEQYRYLVQGEYVDFCLTKADHGNHEWQASSVRGCGGGRLMCETRNEVRESRPISNRDNTRTSVRPRGTGPRGNGPRESNYIEDQQEWLVVRRRPAGMRAGVRERNDRNDRGERNSRTHTRGVATGNHESYDENNR